jgi:hypothetical protein
MIGLWIDRRVLGGDSRLVLAVADHAPKGWLGLDRSKEDETSNECAPESY